MCVGGGYIHLTPSILKCLPYNTHKHKMNPECAWLITTKPCNVPCYSLGMYMYGINIH